MVVVIPQTVSHLQYLDNLFMSEVYEHVTVVIPQTVSHLQYLDNLFMSEVDEDVMVVIPQIGRRAADDPRLVEFFADGDGADESLSRCPGKAFQPIHVVQPGQGMGVRKEWG